MAQQLQYCVPPAPFPTARDELNDLIETLHTSGTLRFLNGFFGRLGAVSDVALTELETPAGRHLLSALLFAGTLATKFSATDLERVGNAFLQSLPRARATLHDREPPSTVDLLKMMHAPETRRALGAFLAVAESIGAALDRPAPSSEQS